MNVLLPQSVDEACRMLAASAGEVVPLAGATDLFVNWPERVHDHDRTYLDLTALADLRSIRWSDDSLTLGALTTYWDVIRDEKCRAAFPLLEAAARQVGAIQIQSRGTWAGNIVNASPAADGVPVLMAYDAVVTLQSQDGCEEIPLSEFYLGYKSMRRRPEQIVTSIRLPRRACDVAIFEKVGMRRAQAIAKVGLAVTHSSDGWRVVAASMAPTVCRCPSVESMLERRESADSPEQLLGSIRADVSPIDDIRSNALYRERVFANLLFHELRPHWAGDERT